MQLLKASHQWKYRPDDERFLNLPSLRDKCAQMREASVARTLHPKVLECRPVESDMEEFDNEAMVIVGPDGVAAGMTHFSFGQITRLAHAPADYLRTLPSDLAADNVNWGLKNQRNKDIGVLLHQTPKGNVLRAATGANYGRVWNDSVVDSIINHFGDGVTGDFRVPGVFGNQLKEVTLGNTTIYGGERDMYIFLADERNRIEIPNRRDGKPGFLARGIFFWNSEVGAESLGVATFLFDFACSNRIIYGATEYREFRIRHSKFAPARFMREVAPAITAYANSSSAGLEKKIHEAMNKRYKSEQAVHEVLAKRFTKNVAAAIKAVHLTEEQRPIETVWDATVAITAYARGIGAQHERVEYEREAGKLLEGKL